MEPALGEPALREPGIEAPHGLRNNIGQTRRAPVQFNLDKQHEYAVIRGMYSRMIRNLVNSERVQDLPYIYPLLMDP
jgi:hypothetical protein